MPMTGEGYVAHVLSSIYCVWTEYRFLALQANLLGLHLFSAFFILLYIRLFYTDICIYMHYAYVSLFTIVIIQIYDIIIRVT